MPKPLLDDTPWHGRHLAARWWPATACKKKPTKSTLCNANKAEVSVSNKNHFLNSLGEGNNKDRKDGLIFHLGFHLWMPNEESLQAVVAKKSRKTCYCNNFAWFLQKLPSLMMMAGPERLHWVHFFLLRIECTSSRPPAYPAPSFKFTVFYCCLCASHRCSLRLILLHVLGSKLSFSVWSRLLKTFKMHCTFFS